MKNLALFALTATLIVSCKSEPKDYVTLSGKITNVNEHKKIIIQNREGYKKEIKVNDDGTFSDTLKVVEGSYFFSDGNESGNIYLKNDNVTSFTLDTKEFDETLKFEGDAAETNNYFVANTLLQEKYLNEDLFDKDEAGFDKVFDDLRSAFADLKATNASKVDSTILADDEKTIDAMYNGYKKYHQGKIAMRKQFPKGSPSPIFENYENYKGGTTSLSDLKGKYVYVDVWATWCGPCKREIPSLKEVEAKYHDKNIEFVSISVDNGRGYKADDKEAAFAASKEGWKKMVAEKELGGIQLFSDKAWESDFVKNYKISGIPRFILIDPDGNIVSPDAPRPSSPKLIELFDSLSI